MRARGRRRGDATCCWATSARIGQTRSGVIEDALVVSAAVAIVALAVGAARRA